MCETISARGYVKLQPTAIFSYTKGLFAWRKSLKHSETSCAKALSLKRFEQVDKRFEQVEKRFEQVDKRFEQVEKRFEQVDKRFEQVDKRFEQVDKRFEELRTDMNARFQDMHTYSSRWFAVISIVLAALTIAVTMSSFVG